VMHTTRDKSWLYVDSPAAPGWLPAGDVASVDSAFIRKWEIGRYAAVVKDETPVYSPTGIYLFHAPLGAVFPLVEEDSLFIRLRAALADAARKAVSCEAVVQRAHAVPKPLPLTLAAVAGLADELLHEPYGWGGLLMNRDCSALIRDLFVPFGIALPRYSADQILSGFGHVDLEALSSSEKEQAILRKGIPFLTMIGPPGHIMLYIGQENGRALVFHNFWGVRTKSFFGKEGRHVVGEAVITTLMPGRELRRFDTKMEILNRVSGMSFVVPPDSVR